MSSSAVALKQMLRCLIGHRFYAAVVLLSLSASIGTSTAVCEIVAPVYSLSLPYANFSRLVTVTGVPPLRDRTATLTESIVPALSQLAEYKSVHADVTTRSGVVRPAIVAVASASFFSVLGVHAEAGQLFDPSRHGLRVAILSHSGLTQLCDGALDDCRVTIHGVHFTAIGVISDRTLPAHASAWIPYDFEQLLSPDVDSSYRDAASGGLTIATLSLGAGAEQAAEELRTLQERLPVSVARSPVEVLSLRDTLLRDQRLSALLLTAVAALVCLVSLTTIAYLSIAHTYRRRQALAIRLALGATTRLLRAQEFATLLALLATAAPLAVGVALWSRSRLAAFEFVSVPTSGDHVSLWQAFAAAVALHAVLLAFLTAVSFWIVPVGSTWDGDGSSALRSRSHPGMRRAARLFVVCSSVTWTVGLCIGAVVERSTSQLLQVDGFVADRLDYVVLEPSGPGPVSQAAASAATEALTDRLRSLPFVDGASAATSVPYMSARRLIPYTALHASRGPGALDVAEIAYIAPRYTSVIGQPILSGRPISDITGSPEALIDRRTAVQDWGGAGGAIGQSVSVNGITFTIVGVVPTIKYQGPAGFWFPQLYLPLRYLRQITVPVVVVRMRYSVEDSVARIRSVAVPSLTPGFVPHPIQAREAINMSSALLVNRRDAVLSLVWLSSIVIVLGACSVSVFISNYRQHECSVRIACGDTRVGVVMLLVTDAVRMSMVGAVVGLLAVNAAGHIFDSLLFGFDAGDLASRIIAAGVTITVAVVSTIIASIFSTRVPVEKLLRAT